MGFSVEPLRIIFRNFLRATRLKLNLSNAHACGPRVSDLGFRNLLQQKGFGVLGWEPQGFGLWDLGPLHTSSQGKSSPVFVPLSPKLNQARSSLKSSCKPMIPESLFHLSMAPEPSRSLLNCRGLGCRSQIPWAWLPADWIELRVQLGVCAEFQQAVATSHP